jgi:hypothetical protein
MEKVFITGTGRCGTTFLIKLLSFLNFHTGYTRETYKKAVYGTCNSGMERKYGCEFYIVKNPTILADIAQISQDPKIKIKAVIIPIRDYDAATASRVKLGKQCGGLWNAQDKATQIAFYHKIMANYMHHMVKNEINTLFLDFEKMTTDKSYLFQKLEFLWSEKNVAFEAFSAAYDEASATC